MATVNSNAIEALRAGKRVRLGELIDINLLVTRHELRKVGIKEPDRITIFPLKNEKVNASGGNFGIGLGVSKDGDDILSLPPEDLYVVLAHESKHMINSIVEIRTGKLLTGQQDEDDARLWEAMQGTRFQWDERDYSAFVKRLIIAAQESGDIPYHTLQKEIREREPVFFAVRRRPVAVRPYRRRR